MSWIMVARGICLWFYRAFLTYSIIFWTVIRLQTQVFYCRKSYIHIFLPSYINLRWAVHLLIQWKSLVFPSQSSLAYPKHLWISSKILKQSHYLYMRGSQPVLFVGSLLEEIYLRGYVFGVSLFHYGVLLRELRSHPMRITGMSISPEQDITHISLISRYHCIFHQKSHFRICSFIVSAKFPDFDSCVTFSRFNRFLCYLQ